MEVTLVHNFKNCHDCPFSSIDRGHGYTAVRCCQGKWEATTSENSIPWDCPISEENKDKTKEDIQKEYAKKDQERVNEWLKPFKDGFKEIGAELVDADISKLGLTTLVSGPFSVEFFIEGGDLSDIAEVIYKNLILMVGTEGTEKCCFEGMNYKFSRGLNNGS